MEKTLLLTVEEVAKLRRRSRWTVYRWVREGYITPQVADFGRFLFGEKELRKLPQLTVKGASPRKTK